MFASVFITYARTCVTLTVSVIVLLTIVHQCVCAPFKLLKLPTLDHDYRPSVVVGCLYKPSLCNVAEYCADDSLLGQCLPLTPALPLSVGVDVHPSAIFVAPAVERPVPSDGGPEAALDRRVLAALKERLVALAEAGVEWSDGYVQCLLEHFHRQGRPQTPGVTVETACQEYIRFPNEGINESDAPASADNDADPDDPLRKYKNGPRIFPKTPTSGAREHNRADNNNNNINDDLSALPLLLIRGKNLPQIEPEVRVLRSADFFSDYKDADDDKHAKSSRRKKKSSRVNDDIRFDNGPEVEDNVNDYDSPYILVGDDESDQSEPETEIKDPVLVLEDVDDPEDDEEHLMKEFEKLLKNSGIDTKGDSQDDEPLFIIDLSDDTPSETGDDYDTPEPSINDILRDPEVDDSEHLDIDKKGDTIKIIDNIIDSGKSDKDPIMEESPEGEDSESQQETIYGTINYNNANDEQARRLSNFYRKHRYDIKKPGPKYFENYFLEGLLPTDKSEKDESDVNDSTGDANVGEPTEKSITEMLSSDAKSVSRGKLAFFDDSRLPTLTLNEAGMNMQSTDDDAEEPAESDVEPDQSESGKTPKTGKSGFEKKLVTEDPESEQTIRSSLPLSEGPVKVDAQLRNTLIIRKADQNESTNLEAIDSTHTYVIMDRQITTDGSKLFIKTLEQVFRLPRGTFSNLRMEKQQITFKVNPNYRDLNASQVAGKIEENAKLLRDITGFWVQESGIGNRAKLPVISPLLNERENQRLIHYTLMVCSAILASLAAAFVILVFRKNLKFREKLKGLMKNADEFIKSDLPDSFRQKIRRDTSGKDAKDGADKELIKDENKGKNKKIGTDQRSSSEGEKVVSPSSRSSTSSWSEEPVTSNMDIATGHLVLTYMEGHLKKKDRLDKEWEALCAYEVEPSATNAAKQAQNAGKNRSPDVLPYDHSRVILNDLVNASKSDYINANSITNSDPRNPAYIATQGPLTGTRADFWQMVWEQGSVCIVMLTRLRESGLSLCDRYWPEEGAETYQDYEVHLVSEHIWCDDFLVRSFYLKNLKTSETRTVTQFHFLSWPESGLPPSTKALLDFRRKINKSYKGKSCPMIVHCSDGIGRTGTYILIDMVLNRLSKGAKEIDIAASLEHLRDQRIGLVKSKQQFEFVLLAVADEVQAILKSLAQN